MIYKVLVLAGPNNVDSGSRSVKDCGCECEGRS